MLLRASQQALAYHKDKLVKSNKLFHDCTNRRITSITVNGKAAYELKGKFLDDLRDNAFSGTNGEDAVEHIEYFLKIVDPIDLPNGEEEQEDEERCELFDNTTQELLIYKIRRFEMIKYSFGQEE
ncbi:hypothetical protein Tco_0695458 [Tanacetum coccineum]